MGVWKVYFFQLTNLQASELTGSDLPRATELDIDMLIVFHYI